MELAHSLLLNEEALGRISESKRPVFIYEWLRFLDKVLVAAQKVGLLRCKKTRLELTMHSAVQAGELYEWLFYDKGLMFYNKELIL